MSAKEGKKHTDKLRADSRSRCSRGRVQDCGCWCHYLGSEFVGQSLDVFDPAGVRVGRASKRDAAKANAELFKEAPTLLEQRDKLVEALRELAEAYEQVVMSEFQTTNHPNPLKDDKPYQEAERVLAEVGE